MESIDSDLVWKKSWAKNNNYSWWIVILKKNGTFCFPDFFGSKVFRKNLRKSQWTNQNFEIPEFSKFRKFSIFHWLSLRFFSEKLLVQKIWKKSSDFFSKSIFVTKIKSFLAGIFFLTRSDPIDSISGIYVSRFW